MMILNQPILVKYYPYRQYPQYSPQYPAQHPKQQQQPNPNPKQSRYNKQTAHNKQIQNYQPSQYPIIMNNQENKIFTQNLYELPVCTICLNQLSSELASLGCGHTFHTQCISQHFQYKGSCPNCQKRAQIKEIRCIVFPVVHNTKTGNYLKQLIESMGKSQGRQVSGLFQQVKQLSQKSQKYANDIKQLQKENHKQNETIQKLKKQNDSKTAQSTQLKKQNTNINKQFMELRLSYQRQQLDYIQLRTNYDNLIAQRRQMEQYRTLQKIASQGSQQIINYKTQLEAKLTPPEAISQQLLQIVKIKCLDIQKIKQRYKDQVSLGKQKQSVIKNLKDTISNLKKQIQQSKQQNEKIKKRFQKIRQMYRQANQKLKSKSLELGQPIHQNISENSLSMSLGLHNNKLVTKASQPLQPSTSEKTQRQLILNITQKPKVAQSKITFGNFLSKKSGEQKKLTLKNFMN